MNKVQREDIYLIGRHSNLTEKGMDKMLKENVYADKEAWQKFLRLFCIVFGIGFTLLGIIFFFAYNWEGLHKFAKIGLLEGLSIVTTSLALFPKFSIVIRRIILTGAAILTGVLFAVFGQIYQTGADAYDFFLVWTVFITLWTIVSNFAPLWMIYLVLINLTIILYSHQVARDWSDIFIFTLLFVINTAVLIIAILPSKYSKAADVPNWFLNTVALASTSYATIGIIVGIFEDYQTSFLLLILIALVVFALGIWHGSKTRSGFYLSVIPFSLVVIISAALIKISDGKTMFLLIGLFIVGSVTLIIKNLIANQRK